MPELVGPNIPWSCPLPVCRVYDITSATASAIDIGTVAPADATIAMALATITIKCPPVAIAAEMAITPVGTAFQLSERAL